MPFASCARRAMGSKLPVSLTAYSVVGAAAYMGGATRMTLTTTVMVMETTGALQLIVPIMLAVFVAKARAQLRAEAADASRRLDGAPRLSCCRSSGESLRQ